jgi:hypothetical protein
MKPFLTEAAWKRARPRPEKALDMEQDYKGHHIKSLTRHLPDSDRWTAHAIISWTDGLHEQFRQFDVKRGFATEEEAGEAGVIFAKKWIDNGKPKLR